VVRVHGVCTELGIVRDKNTPDGAQGNAWYDRAVPIADEIWRAIMAAEAL
jgi:hypothetical protein